ncbi:MAG: R3H domain-containing nucleic acid-binding protein, partial [bacterium]
LQHIVYKMAGRAFAGRDLESIVIDIDGYRKNREGELSRMAGEIAERVSRSGESELLQPMSAWERKIVHQAVKQSDDLETQSEDSDTGRRVRIRRRKKE